MFEVLELTPASNPQDDGWGNCCRRAVDCGWANVSLHSRGGADPSQSAQFLTAARRAVELGLTLRSIVLEWKGGCGLGDPLAQRRETAVADVADWLVRADEVGAKDVIVQFASPGSAGPNPTYQEALNATAWSLADLRRPLECCEASLALTVGSEGFLMSPPEARELIDNQCSPHVGVCLRPPSGMPLGRIEDWVQTMGHRMRAVSLAADHPWDAVRATLRETGYEGTLSTTDLNARHNDATHGEGDIGIPRPVRAE